ncbi:hypothetical protein ZIOFF_015941 [Zingiber officinale]|uniref:Myb/SANT-like domain-containing protein n=1 Tax=Zingiber officinale TaxID=94328 RepID=A0A8J5HEX3_ZINOF|nr:hypothetical protein ZIOFF_015941 [Zingiber officinale]
MGGHNPSIEIEKYDWSKTNVVMFVNIIYEKVKHNKLQTSTFTNTVWEEINKELYQVTNKNYSVERLKGKWNRLRTRQRLFAALLAHTGVTMDPDTDKVNAPEEVWAECGQNFIWTTATGDMHRASTQLPPTSNEERELEEAFINRGVSSYVEVVDDENEDVGGEPNNRRHRNTEPTESHRRKDPKRSKIGKYDAYMDKWSDTLQHLSQESIARQKYLDLRAAKLEHEQEISSSTGTSRFSDPYSIDMCMQILNQMDDLSTQVYTKATEAFGKPWLREIMSNFDDEYDELGPDINLLLILSHANDFFHEMTQFHRSIDRMPCRTSSLTGRMYIQEILDGHPQACFDNFCISKHVFVNFCRTLKEMNLLQDGKKVTIEEGAAMFLLIIGHNTRHRICADQFQHSLYTCSKWFKQVLRVVCTLGTHIIRPYEHNDVHPHILHNPKWFHILSYRWNSRIGMGTDINSNIFSW